MGVEQTIIIGIIVVQIIVFGYTMLKAGSLARIFRWNKTLEIEELPADEAAEFIARSSRREELQEEIPEDIAEELKSENEPAVYADENSLEEVEETEIDTEAEVYGEYSSDDIENANYEYEIGDRLYASIPDNFSGLFPAECVTTHEHKTESILGLKITNSSGNLWQANYTILNKPTKRLELLKENGRYTLNRIAEYEDDEMVGSSPSNFRTLKAGIIIFDGDSWRPAVKSKIELN